MIAAAAQRNRISHIFVVTKSTKIKSVAAKITNINAGNAILLLPLLQHVVNEITDPKQQCKSNDVVQH